MRSASGALSRMGNWVRMARAERAEPFEAQSAREPLGTRLGRGKDQLRRISACRCAARARGHPIEQRAGVSPAELPAQCPADRPLCPLVRPSTRRDTCPRERDTELAHEAPYPAGIGGGMLQKIGLKVVESRPVPEGAGFFHQPPLHG